MFKKTVIIFTLLAICWSVRPQDTLRVAGFPRHEIKVSTGVFNQMSVFFFNDITPAFLHGYKYEDAEYQQLNIGSFSLSYRYHITPMHSIGVVSTLLFSKVTDKYYVDDHSGLFTYWAVEPQYRLTYQRFNWGTIYLAAALGFTVRFASNDQVCFYDTHTGGWFSYYAGRCHVVPSTHVTFVGVSVGKDNAANFELGFGTQGVFNVGYSCRF